jgi:hypothetical protein
MTTTNSDSDSDDGKQKIGAKKPEAVQYKEVPEKLDWQEFYDNTGKTEHDYNLTKAE